MGLGGKRPGAGREPGAAWASKKVSYKHLEQVITVWLEVRALQGQPIEHGLSCLRIRYWRARATRGLQGDRANEALSERGPAGARRSARRGRRLAPNRLRRDAKASSTVFGLGERYGAVRPQSCFARRVPGASRPEHRVGRELDHNEFPWR
jgi:hypothetical protein